MLTDSYDDFLKWRDEALLSMNKLKIRRFMQRFGIPIPKEDEVFWLAVHKLREATLEFPEDVRRESRLWLRQHGYLTMLESERVTGL